MGYASESFKIKKQDELIFFVFSNVSWSAWNNADRK